MGMITLLKGTNKWIYGYEFMGMMEDGSEEID